MQTPLPLRGLHYQLCYFMTVAFFLLLLTGAVEEAESFVSTAGTRATCLPLLSSPAHVGASPTSKRRVHKFMSRQKEIDSPPPLPRISVQVQLVSDLDEVLTGNVTAALALLNKCTDLRNSGRQEEADHLIDSLLSVLDDDAAKFMPWVRIRPLARYSRRSRRASLRRVLDLSTPVSEDSGQDDTEGFLRTRRRSFIILLRTLANPGDGDRSDENNVSETRVARLVCRLTQVPRIVSIEKLARLDASTDAPVDDMDRRVPSGLETPKYTVLARRKEGYEIRSYDPYSLCTVAMDKTRPAESAGTDAKVSNPQLAGASSFGALAGYLFGKNDQSLSMKMTTPVVTAGPDDARQMSFVLPSEYWSKESLDVAPKPLDSSGVFLQRDAGGNRAVVMFGGFAGRREYKKRKIQLLEYLQNDDEWESLKDVPVALAQYNDPFTPPWKRRNEVSVPVVSKKK